MNIQGALSRSRQRFGWLWMASLPLVIFAFPLNGQETEGPEPSSHEFPASPLTEIIDSEFQEIWASQRITPASPADAHILLRRVYLDLWGRPPTEHEARQFLQEPTPEAYTATVDRLLASPRFDRQLAVALRRIWLPQLETQQFAHLIDPYQTWLARRLQAGAAYDELVWEQLTAPVEGSAIATDPIADSSGSPIFLSVADLEPALLAANTSRAFLGLNLDCAQCHDHPVARWSQRDFWRTAAWFSKAKLTDQKNFTLPVIQVGDTDQYVTASYPGSAGPPEVEITDSHSAPGRVVLAEWMRDAENPFFARNAVNRVWSYLMGHGLVEPVDDLTGVNVKPTSRLLSRLAENFRRDGYNLHELVRSIVLSRAYQLSGSGISFGNVADASEVFAVATPRLLSGDTLSQSLIQIGGFLESRTKEGGFDELARAFHSERPAVARRSLVQALSLMNGETIEQLTNPQESPAVIAIAHSPYLSQSERVESLYLRTLSRFPSSEEIESAVAFLGPHEQDLSLQAERVADLLWVLINSAEFGTIQ